MRLDGNQSARLMTVLEAAFDPHSFAAVLAMRASNFPLHSVTTAMAPFPNQIVAVVQAFNQRNEIERLVSAVRDARPLDLDLARLHDDLALTRVPSRAELEVLIRRDGRPFADVEAFRRNLALREAQVCMVEVSTGAGEAAVGSGFLIAEDLVLTNHHVVVAAMFGDALEPGSTICRFDHRVAPDGATVFEGTPVRVAELVAASPPAAADLDGSDNVDGSKLDYALLRLEGPTGRTPAIPGGPARGFVPVRPLAVEATSPVLLLQHPKGRPMQISLGVTEAPRTTRVRHSADTEPGSSGAPLLDFDLRVAALHHAGRDWPSEAPPYNQAIPIQLIVEHARAAGAPL